MKLLVFLKILTCFNMFMASLRDSRESGNKSQDDETTTKYIVPCTMLFDTIIQNKTSPQLLNFILDIVIPDTMIGLKSFPKVCVNKVLSKPMQSQIIMGGFYSFHDVEIKELLFPKYNNNTFVDENMVYYTDGDIKYYII